MFLDGFLSGFKWYRRSRGGKWFKVTLDELNTKWTQDEPKSQLLYSVVDSEVYLEAYAIDQISDGYHSFQELYTHRNLLFIALANASPMTLPWKSGTHDDGSSIEGWFIAGLTLPSGPITYHLPARHWDLLRVPILSKAPKWDGHTSHDVVERLKGAIAGTVIERMKTGEVSTPH